MNAKLLARVRPLEFLFDIKLEHIILYKDGNGQMCCDIPKATTSHLFVQRMTYKKRACKRISYLTVP